MRMNSQRRRDHRDRLWKDQKGRCAYCDRPMTPTVPNGTHQVQSSATIDHLIPASRMVGRPPGGLGARGRNNTVLACRRCNQKKGDRTPLEFFMGIPSPRQMRKGKERAA